MRNILVAAVLLAVRTANADQCAVVPQEQAQAAAKLLTDVAVQLYCGPCGDAKPSVASTTVAHKVRAHDGRVELEGKDVDLAYVYAKTGPATFTNVGLAVGCEAKDVAPFLGFASTEDPMSLSRMVAAVNARIAHDVDVIAAAKSQKDRDAANAQLQADRKEKAELEQKLVEAKAADAKRQRQKGVTISKECQQNPLAKGCP